MKFCSKCEINRNSGEFYPDKSKKDGLSSYCKGCRKENTKKRYSNNRDIIKEYKAKHYLANKEEINNKNHEYYKNNKVKVDLINKKWALENRDKVNKSARVRKNSRRKVDLLYKLTDNVRNRLRYAIKAKSWSKNIKFSEYLGCSKEELMQHIEKQFKPGMTWDNYGVHGWHVDHKIALSLAKSEEEMYKLCHYTNLQPLWAIENIRKGNKCPL